MSEAFDRFARVTLAKPRPDPTTKIGRFFGQLLPSDLELEGGSGKFRVQFEIKKSGKKSPNTCKVTISNLGPSIRDEIAQLPMVLLLEAGYAAGEVRQIWIGDVFHVQSEQDGEDWETTIQALDGGRAYANARVNRTFSAGATLLDAVQDTAAAMGLAVPRDVLTNRSLQAALSAGMTLAGSAADELSRLLEPIGLGWSVQDGSLVVLSEGGIRPGEAILIDEQAGMIGSPKWSTPTRPGKKPTLSVSCLLFPEVAAGVRLRVKSRSANGDFKVTSVTHQGDTHGSDGESWSTSIEARAAT